jgi:hypothetical protein
LLLDDFDDASDIAGNECPSMGGLGDFRGAQHGASDTRKDFELGGDDGDAYEACGTRRRLAFAFGNMQCLNAFLALARELGVVDRPRRRIVEEAQRNAFRRYGALNHLWQPGNACGA